MLFVQGESYTRDFIHDQLGGEKVSYLPQKGGRIVCGCFSTVLPLVTVVLTDSHRKSAAGSIMPAMMSWTPAIGFNGDGAGAAAWAALPDWAVTAASCFGVQPVSKAPSTPAHAAILPNPLTPIETSGRCRKRRAWYTGRQR